MSAQKNKSKLIASGRYATSIDPSSASEVYGKDVVAGLLSWLRHRKWIRVEIGSMCVHLLVAATLIIGGWTPGFADSPDWRVTPAPQSISDSDKNQIGRVVCGEGGYETSGTGVRCKVCPEFTDNGGSDEGLEIEAMIRGRFTSAKSPGEWMLDTQGCEAHFQSFGGAILLAPPDRKPFIGTPTMTLGASLTAKPAPGPLAMVFYKPGYRLNDCLPFGADDTRTLLVCNEYDVAQGEVIGHVSSMEISRRGINRWRLLRWYDNSGTDLAEVLTVIPTGMRRMEPDKGKPGLQIKLKIVESGREAYEKAPEAPGKTLNLVFRRRGQRFFATEKTQAHLKEIGDLTRKMLE